MKFPSGQSWHRKAMKTISLIFHMLQGCCSGLSMLIDYLNGYVGDLHLEFRWEAQTEKIRFESHESGRTQPQRTKKEEDQVWELEETSTLRQRPREMSGCRKLREIEVKYLVEEHRVRVWIWTLVIILYESVTMSPCFTANLARDRNNNKYQIGRKEKALPTLEGKTSFT